MAEPNWEAIERDYDDFIRHMSRYYQVDRDELESYLYALIEEREMPAVEEQLALGMIFGEE